jgi:hypothetical protein
LNVTADDDAATADEPPPVVVDFLLLLQAESASVPATRTTTAIRTFPIDLNFIVAPLVVDR